MALSPKKYWRKKAILIKVETDEGTDAVPTAALNAIQMSDVTLTPIEGDEVSRDLYRPFLGAQDIIPVGLYARLEGSIEMAGAGTAGTAPAWGPVMRMCGFAETIVEDTSVTYSRISDDMESGTIHYHSDGIRHILLGAKGTWTLEATPKGIPRFKFTLTGLLGTISDQALPVPDLAAFTDPVPVSKANTTLTLHGVTAATAPVESITLDTGNQVEARHLVGEESIQITDFSVSGQVVAELKPLTTKDWFAAYLERPSGALSIIHGTVAGNIVEFDSDVVKIGKPTYGQTNGIANVTLPLLMVPEAGGDDLHIIVR